MDETAGHEARRARKHHQRRRSRSREEGRRGEGRATRHHPRGTNAASARQGLRDRDRFCDWEISCGTELIPLFSGPRFLPRLNGFESAWRGRSFLGSS